MKPRLRVQEHECRATVGHAKCRDSTVCMGMVPIPEGLLVYAGLGQEPTERSGLLGKLQLWFGEPTGLLEPQDAYMGHHDSLQEQPGVLLQLKAMRTLKLQSPNFLLTP